ncbi:Manganese transporter SMF2 [Candida viswanathii]|uniref:Manganese transporter SMF2 n=1 Tax=Candida viswanathii TaxID=5486 RepID=A0A367YCH7_9ASCO|nr:Manganese transporter SMF2 [Candida viswanathii]
MSSITKFLNLKSLASAMKKYSRFIGPGLMVSVAYMDPGNYSTAVAAGSAYKYNLLFLILLSNCLAVFLQILAAKLGAVTGLDLAANCKAHFSHRTNLILYGLTEIAIIATDLAEVVGTAIALNILFKIPLFAGVIITVIDVLVVLMAYRPKGPLLFIRIFEGFVSILVAATVVCFGIELYQVSHDDTINFSVIEVLKGFLPNEDVVDMSEREGGNGLFLSLAILGATVMPHSLYLGSGLVQSRLKDYDVKNGFYKPWGKRSIEEPRQESTEEEDIDGRYSITHEEEDTLTPIATPLVQHNQQGFEKDDDITLEASDEEDDHYRPSIHAIKDTMAYTIVELVISLFTVALFVNAAILIVAGATLDSGNSRRDDHDHDDGHESDSDSDDDYENADLFTIYHLLSKHLSPTAGFVFALALLCSGQSAGVVCTLAGQMVSEGFLNWTLPPVARRLITRALAIAPCLLVVSFSGREGLGKILNASQVVLSILLPVVSAPLIWFTCNKTTMRVPIFVRDGDEEIDILFDDNENGNQHSTHGVTTSRFKSSEPAIRLQDLRKSHPCAGWDEDDEEHHLQLEENRRLIGDANLESAAYSKPHSTVMKSRTNSVSVQQDSVQPPTDDSTASSSISTPSLPIEVYEDRDQDIYRIKGYKDFSNGPGATFSAVLVWAFVTFLNLYLIGSMILGYDVPL